MNKNEEINSLRKKLFDDGCLHLRNVISNDFLQRVDVGIDWAIENPSPFKLNKISEGNRFFMDFGNWRRNESIKELCCNTELAQLVASLIESKTLRLMHEDIILKEGFSENSTPPHHDRPYFIFEGINNISAWISPDDIPSSSCLVCYKGSHLSGKVYRPKRFDSADNIHLANEASDITLEDLDDLELQKYEEIKFDYKKGDVILFFNTTIHSAPSNFFGQKRKSFVIRYLSDNATLSRNPFATVPPYHLMGINFSNKNIYSEKLFPIIWEG